MKTTHGGKRDNRKKRVDDKRGGKRIPGPGKKLGRPKKDKPLSTVDRGFNYLPATTHQSARSSCLA